MTTIGVGNRVENRSYGRGLRVRSLKESNLLRSSRVGGASRTHKYHTKKYLVLSAGPAALGECHKTWKFFWRTRRFK